MDLTSLLSKKSKEKMIIISGIETMNMLRKEQVDGLDRNALLECKFINGLFGISV